ncbi:MAG: glutathione S-transferase C-terminal domain-containing protein, partial [Phycisphaerales bacterium]|nr:glutathione S-transferase C-terminal domain-containing protein [Phycisphaerales bacterium]
YRHIAYRMLFQGAPELSNYPQPKVHLFPTFYLPGETGKLEAVTDSTPLIRRFEREFPGRSVIPSDPAMAFLDLLLEDYGDEWLTKAMFHYRWAFQPDIDKAATILPLHMQIGLPPADVDAMGRVFSGRQIERLRVVGSNEITGSVIEASYRRFLELFDAHLQQQPFLMGGRPGSSDFACYGQLTQLTAFDPTPMEVTLATAPRVLSWTQTTDDLSGLEPQESDWLESASVPETLRALLGEVGRVYVPCMLANAAAVEAGAPEVETTVDGERWVQQPFPYQAKCVRWLREARAELPADVRERVDGILAGTGCEALFSST